MEIEELGRRDWAAITKRVTLYAYHRLRRIGVDDVEVAQDLAQEAVRRLFDPEYASWDESRQPDLLRFLGSTVNGLVSNLRRKRMRRGDHQVDDGFHHGSSVGAQRPQAASRTEARQRVAWFVTQLQERFDASSREIAVLELLLDGCEIARDQAATLECDVREVYQARRRLRDYIGELRLEEEALVRAEVDHDHAQARDGGRV